MKKYEALFKQAINLNIPIKFSYWSNKSPFFPDAENPAHDRIVQPLVLGVKQWPNGKKAVYFRGYLLSQYSYSRNKYFDNEFTNNARKPRYFRLYNVAKVKNCTLVPDFPKEKRFFPQKHKEYNPNDKFFNQIMFSMSPTTTYSYQFTGKEESAKYPKAIREVTNLLSEHKIKYKKPIRFYAISEEEEVGFLDKDYTWINTVWASQTSNKNLLKGLKSLR